MKIKKWIQARIDRCLAELEDTDLRPADLWWIAFAYPCYWGRSKTPEGAVAQAKKAGGDLLKRHGVGFWAVQAATTEEGSFDKERAPYVTGMGDYNYFAIDQEETLWPAQLKMNAGSQEVDFNRGWKQDYPKPEGYKGPSAASN